MVTAAVTKLAVAEKHIGLPFRVSAGRKLPLRSDNHVADTNGQSGAWPLIERISYSASDERQPTGSASG
jgi:hypothetical protein